MGVDISDIVPKTVVELEHLTGRTIAIDAYNTLYQFLSVIRQPDGTPLQNSKGEITSHLTGLLYRTTNLVEQGIKPCFVFDGVPPEKKHETIMKRIAIRMEAKEKWDEALEKGDIEEARRYAQQSVKLTKEMVEQSKELLSAMGIPYVQAPSEGEAQASYMCSNGKVWGVGSQDFDSLLFGAPRLVRNLTITGRRKLPRKNVYVMIKPEIIQLDSVLSELGITREQLIEIGLIVGTDYNEGVKGIGPKKALALVKKGKSAEEVFNEHNMDTKDLKKIRMLFLKPDVTDEYTLTWGTPDTKKLIELLVEKYEFSEDRVKRTAERLSKALEVKGTQSRLDQWFGG
ncbi:MAG: flap endonuclease-1 [Candidatus Diapherotrites archaeon]|nr:flap endonuclease-1 [Candidatus Diapherotrites archaeon]